MPLSKETKPKKNLVIYKIDILPINIGWLVGWLVYFTACQISLTIMVFNKLVRQLV